MFIPVEKMKKLRDSARNGDERAKKILIMQMDGKEDFSSLMDEYFAEPKPTEVVENGLGEAEMVETVSLDAEPKDEKLEKFLQFNGVTKDSPDYKSYVEDYYKENPKPHHDGMEHEQHEEECFLDKLIGEEIEAINSYNEAIMKIMNLDDLNESARKGMIAKLNEIKNDEMEHFEELKRLKADLNKKEEKEEEAKQPEMTSL